MKSNLRTAGGVFLLGLALGVIVEMFTATHNLYGQGAQAAVGIPVALGYVGALGVAFHSEYAKDKLLGVLFLVMLLVVLYGCWSFGYGVK